MTKLTEKYSKTSQVPFESMNDQIKCKNTVSLGAKSSNLNVKPFLHLFTNSLINHQTNF